MPHTLRYLTRKEMVMADQAVLDRYAQILVALDTKEAYLYEGELYVRHEYRDPQHMQTRMTYHRVGEDNSISDDNIVKMSTWGKAQKNGERLK
jgi:hypothetical protein